MKGDSSVKYEASGWRLAVVSFCVFLFVFPPLHSPKRRIHGMHFVIITSGSFNASKKIGFFFNSDGVCSEANLYLKVHEVF